MSGKTWNSGMNYLFSVHRVGMTLLGTWPLGPCDFFSKVRWLVAGLMKVTMTALLAVELFFYRSNSRATMEWVFSLNCFTIAIVKHISLRLNARRLEENMTFAVNDWHSAQEDEEARKIMNIYARRSKLIKTMMLFAGVFGMVFVCGVAIFTRNHNIAAVVSGDGNSTIFRKRNFIFAISWLSEERIRAYYYTIFVSQIIQMTVLSMQNCLTDSYYFIIVMHLAGQLEVLRVKFGALGKAGSDNDYKSQLSALVKRQCALIKLVENLQSTFGIIILLQVGLSPILFSMTGVQLLVNIKHRDKVSFIKNAAMLEFIFLQSFLYIYAGDILAEQSECIFQSVFETPWYNFSLGLVKDLTFVMRKASIPLRLSGGKFFYVTRTTMMNILKASFSYISVLQVTIS